MPERVHVYEIGPRDGLQNQQTIFPVEVRAEFIRRLVDAGFDAVELTGFVRPTWNPQLGNADALLARHGPLKDRHPVLLPNELGLDRALSLGVSEIAVFGSTTGSFAVRNLNRSIAASFKMFAPVIRRVPRWSIPVHFHDTVGQGLVRTFAGLQLGGATADTSAGGGCPYGGCASDNLANKDLVWQLDSLGIETGIGLESLCATSLWEADRLGRPSPSKALAAMTSTSRKADR
jgi:hydroxymethylglutaryl-CoA lyase